MFIMVLPGAMAISIVPDLPNADMVFPTITTTLLPAGLTGLVLAGLIAAIMSSVDSTLISHDFMNVAEKSPAAQRRVGRITTMILMAVAILWAPFIDDMGGLWDYLQQAFSILVPPVVVIFLLGALWRRGTRDAAFHTLWAGHLISLGFFAMTQAGIWPLHFTTNVGVMAALSAIIFVGVSLADDAPSAEEVEDVTWRPEMASDGTVDAPLWADIRIWASLLAVAMLAILIGFW
jgi:SSS family solute:Na+ symporter